jgi:cytochrome c5
MKSSFKAFALIATVAFFISACAGAAIMPLQTDADRMAETYPGTTLAELTEGRELFKTHCGKCHGLIKPTSLGEEKWKKMVHVMAPKAKLGEAEEAKILKYVLATCHAPAK